MINQEIINYINFHLKKGVFWETIKKDLLDAGWPDADLEENYQQILKEKIAGSAVYREPIEEKDLAVEENLIEPIKQDQPLESEPVELFNESEAKPDFSPIEKYNYPEVQENNLTPAQDYTTEPIDQEERDLGGVIENPIEQPITEEPEQVSPISVGKNPKKNLTAIIISLILFLLIVSGGAFAYYEYIFPQQLFLKALDNISDNLDTRAMELSQSFVGSVSLKEPYQAYEKNINNASLELNLKTEIDFNNDQKLVANAFGDLKVLAQEIQGGTIEAKASFEARTDDNIVFFLAKEIVGLEKAFEFFGENSEQAAETSQLLIQNFSNQWISAPISAYQLETYAEIKQSYEQAKQKLFDFYKANRADIIKVAKIKKIGSEKIENDDCFVFEINFNKAEMKKVFLNFASYYAYSPEIFESNLQFYEDNFENDVWPSLEKIEMKVWVTKNDPIFRKYSLAYEDNFENYPSSPFSSVFFTYDGTYKKLNSNSVIVYIPESTKTLEQAMESLMQIDYGQTQSSSKNSLTKALLDQASMLANIYKAENNTYIGFISKGGGAELINEMNSLGGRQAFVYTAKDKYCVIKELPETKDSWWCVDHTGYKGLSNNCTKNTYSCK